MGSAGGLPPDRREAAFASKQLAALRSTWVTGSRCVEPASRVESKQINTRPSYLQPTQIYTEIRHQAADYRPDIAGRIAKPTVSQLSVHGVVARSPPPAARWPRSCPPTHTHTLALTAITESHHVRLGNPLHETIRKDRGLEVELILELDLFLLASAGMCNGQRTHITHHFSPSLVSGSKATRCS